MNVFIVDVEKVKDEYVVMWVKILFVETYLSVGALTLVLMCVLLFEFEVFESGVELI